MYKLFCSQAIIYDVTMHISTKGEERLDGKGDCEGNNRSYSSSY